MMAMRLKCNSLMKYKIILSIVLSVILSFVIVFRFSTKVSNAIINTAEALIKRENTMMFKKAFGSKNQLNINADDLIIVHKNAKEEIMEVDFKIKDCERIMVSIIENMDGSTNMISTEGYIIDVPIGYITNSPLLLNLGPKIPVKITTTDVALGSVSTSIREFGINNVLIEIYINIEIETNAILPLKTGTTKNTFNFLVASKIISGKVPDFYGGYISKESSEINIPIM